ncbi:MAG: hypothetical protein IH621_06875, partial [Krumholzibacteria bacterium]|nr:hypothetical protein [Candidatus Krumholzibacteria bacterium]
GAVGGFRPHLVLVELPGLLDLRAHRLHEVALPQRGIPLVSDILVYNRDQRDAALREGNLVQAMGPEIKKSWELYKDKVGAEAANGTSHFRDALNEILAEGEKVF